MMWINTHDSSMNTRRVIIKNAFGSLENMWCILRHFNSKVDRATRVVAYSVLHNYCLEWSAPKPSPRNVVALQTISKDLGINYQ
jgi:hypothetical protein